MTSTAKSKIEANRHDFVLKRSNNAVIIVIISILWLITAGVLLLATTRTVTSPEIIASATLKIALIFTVIYCQYSTVFFPWLTNQVQLGQDHDWLSENIEAPEQQIQELKIKS